MLYVCHTDTKTHIHILNNFDAKNGWAQLLSTLTNVSFIAADVAVKSLSDVAKKSV